jgi:hypothetical protein
MKIANCKLQIEGLNTKTGNGAGEMPGENKRHRVAVCNLTFAV